MYATKKELKTRLVVQRSNWQRGDWNSEFFVKGKYCVLGFAALASGYETEDIDKVLLPEDLAEIKGIMRKLVIRRTAKYRRSHVAVAGPYEDRRIVRDIWTVNDDPEMLDIIRETKLIKLFAKIGISLEFVD